MLAFSIRQPHADLIASGRKTIEMRTWSTDYRGPLIICASAQGKKSGHTLCLVHLVDVRLFKKKDCKAACYDGWEPDDDFTAWDFRLIRAVPHIPMKGRLRLYPLDPPIAKKLKPFVIPGEEPPRSKPPRPRSGS